MVKVRIANGHYISKLELTKQGKLTSILSEGEQKAVALSLFLAEIKILKQNNPIIVDDPVNSLDHKIAGAFAQRLLNIDNQTVVFTHHKLFLDALETSRQGHVCGDINLNGCRKKQSKHILLYTVQSEGKSSKGIIILRKAHNAKNYISSAKHLLNSSPFTKQEEVCVKFRRAVECIIDEKVFNGLTPTKLSLTSSRIKWDKLKALSSDKKIITDLKNIHNRVSGGELHEGTESSENPIEKVELDSMHVTLSQYVN